MPARRRGSDTPTRDRKSSGKASNSTSPNKTLRAEHNRGPSVPNPPLTAAYESQKALVSQYLESLITQGEGASDDKAAAPGEATSRQQRASAAASETTTGHKRPRSPDNVSGGVGEEDEDDEVVLDVMSATTIGLPGKERIKEACRTLTRRIDGRLGDISHSHQIAMETASEQIINDEFLVLKKMTDEFAEGVALWSQQAEQVVNDLGLEQENLKGYLAATQQTLRDRRERFEELNRQRTLQFEVDIAAMLAESENALAEVLPPESRQASMSLARLGVGSSRGSEQQQQQHQFQPLVSAPPLPNLHLSSHETLSAPRQVPPQALIPGTPLNAMHSMRAAVNMMGDTALPPPPVVPNTAPRSRAPSMTPTMNTNTTRSAAATATSASISLGRSHTNNANSRHTSRSPAAVPHSAGTGGSATKAKTYSGAMERRFTSLQPANPTQAPNHSAVSTGNGNANNGGLSHTISATRALNKSLSALAARSTSHVSETQGQLRAKSSQSQSQQQLSSRAVSNGNTKITNGYDGRTPASTITNSVVAANSLLPVEKQVFDAEFGDIVDEDELLLGPGSQPTVPLVNINYSSISRSLSKVAPIIANEDTHNNNNTATNQNSNPFFAASARSRSTSIALNPMAKTNNNDSSREVARPLLDRFEEEAAALAALNKPSQRTRTPKKPTSAHGAGKAASSALSSQYTNISGGGGNKKAAPSSKVVPISIEALLEDVAPAKTGTQRKR